jgi:hypothetical protein
MPINQPPVPLPIMPSCLFVAFIRVFSENWLYCHVRPSLLRSFLILTLFHRFCSAGTIINYNPCMDATIQPVVDEEVLEYRRHEVRQWDIVKSVCSILRFSILSLRILLLDVDPIFDAFFDSFLEPRRYFHHMHFSFLFVITLFVRFLIQSLFVIY